MLAIFQTLNNITSHRLLIIGHGVLSESYYYQTTKNFEKLLHQERDKNTLMITTLIFLVFYMHIEPIRLLEDNAPIAKFDTDKKLYLDSTSLDEDDSIEIEEAITMDKDNKDKNEDLQKRNR